MSRERVNYLLTVNLPENVSPRAMRIYIEDALKMACKAEHPDNPVFNLRRRDIRVQFLGSRGSYMKD